MSGGGTRTAPAGAACGGTMDCLTVAALGAITDYSDVTVRGYLKDHPEWVIYRLDVLAWMIATVRAQAEAETAAGTWGPRAGELGTPEEGHHEEVAAYAAHTCNCEWCLHAVGGNDSVTGRGPRA